MGDNEAESPNQFKTLTSHKQHRDDRNEEEGYDLYLRDIEAKKLYK